MRRRPLLRLRILLLLAAVTVASPVDAAYIKLEWDAPTTNSDGSPLTDLAKYRVYHRTSSGSCQGTTFQDVAAPTPTPGPGTVTFRLTNLPATTHFMSVSALDFAGNESACSNEVSGVARNELAVSPSGTVGFGSVPVGNSLDYTFTVRNNGTTSLTVSVAVGAPFSVVLPGPSFPVAAGGSRAVIVRFAPTVAGPVTGSASFTSSGGNLTRNLSGTATVSTVSGITPDPIDLAAPPSSFTVNGLGFTDAGHGLPVVNFVANGSLLAQVRATALAGTALTVPYPTGAGLTSGGSVLPVGSVTVMVHNQTGTGSFALVGRATLTVTDTRATSVGITIKAKPSGPAAPGASSTTTGRSVTTGTMSNPLAAAVGSVASRASTTTAGTAVANTGTANPPSASAAGAVTPDSIDLMTPPASLTITGQGFADLGFGLPVVDFVHNGTVLAQVRATALSGPTLTVPYPASPANGYPGLSAGRVKVRIFNQTGPRSLSPAGTLTLTVR